MRAPTAPPAPPRAARAPPSPRRAALSSPALTARARLCRRRGYNIGVRLIDEFLAKAQVGQCGNFSETAEVIAKVGFKMFLGVTAEVRPPPSSVPRATSARSSLACRLASRALRLRSLAPAASAARHRS